MLALAASSVTLSTAVAVCSVPFAFTLCGLLDACVEYLTCHPEPLKRLPWARTANKISPPELRPWYVCPTPPNTLPPAWLGAHVPEAILSEILDELSDASTDVF